MKKKVWISVVAVTLLIVTAGIGTWKLLTGKEEKKEVSVSNVGEMQEVTGNGVWNRYVGVAETKNEWEMAFQPEKEVMEWYVEEGQEVTEGTVLFQYDTTKIQENLAQSQLDLDTIVNEKQNLNEQLAALEKAKKEAEKGEQVSYDIEVLNTQASLKAKELEEINKVAEIASLQNSMDTSTITSPIAGVVQSMNKTGEKKRRTGETEPLISIVGMGSVRIKGLVNELNVSDLKTEDAVIIRSRADENVIWKGKITEIDTQTPLKSMGTNDYSSSTQYPFYIELEHNEGLMIGQHVLIELDYGQEERKKGIWLDEFMMVTFDDAAYVWADNGNGLLEKKKILLGEYDKDRRQYEIQSGLSQSDWIAFPEEDLEEGMPTVKVQTNQIEQKENENMETEGDGDDSYTGEYL